MAPGTRTSRVFYTTLQRELETLSSMKGLPEKASCRLIGCIPTEVVEKPAVSEAERQRITFASEMESRTYR